MPILKNSNETFWFYFGFLLTLDARKIARQTDAACAATLFYNTSPTKPIRNHFIPTIGVFTSRWLTC